MLGNDFITSSMPVASLANVGRLYRRWYRRYCCRYLVLVRSVHRRWMP